MTEKDYYNGWNDEGNLNKILSCPFCGGNGELLDNGYEHPVIDENGAYVDMDIFEGDTFWIECEKCGAMMTGADTPEKAIEEWNKRTGSGWIPVEERLPEEPKETPEFDNKPLGLYLVDIGGSYPLRAFWNGKQFTDGWSILKVIAWMPLPEPYTPKKGAEECQNEES